MAPRLVSPSPVAASPLARVSSVSASADIVQNDARDSQLLVVSCYTRFDNLAHGPRGTEARRSLFTYRMDPNDGQMVLLSVTDDDVMNPAFSRFRPDMNLLYTCTESVAELGQIVTWSVCPSSGELTKVSSACAQGTSTCYLTLDRECKNMLVVNYWNATIGVFGLDADLGHVANVRSLYDPNEGREMKVNHNKHVNHSENDKHAQRERQSDPHSHAVVLDSFFGRIAYVPDLGMDVIREFFYDPDAGVLTPTACFRSGPEGCTSLGPRYLEFHPRLPVCYVVNELASEVSVFAFDIEAAKQLVQSSGSAKDSKPTLRLMQTIRTIPEAIPGDMNTCGRITVHSAGNFVLVSNRGHDSIAVFRVGRTGKLSLAAIQHTRGATPRHFGFDGSGQWLVTANQDSNCISVFHFNLATGRLDWTGHEYAVPSPNFVCSVQPQKDIAVRADASGSLPAECLGERLRLGQQAPASRL